MKEVLIVSGIFPPDIGGPASFIPLLATELTKRKFSVNVVTLADDLNSLCSYESFKVYRISRKLSYIKRFLTTVKTIIKHAKTADLIFSCGLDLEAVLSAKLSGKKCIVKIVGDIAWERATGNSRFAGSIEEFNKRDLNFKNNIDKLYRQVFIALADKIITPSEYLRSVVYMWNKRKNVSVIYNCVKANDYSGAEKSLVNGIFKIITVARLVQHKGVQRIIEAVSRLEFPYELHVVGDGPLSGSLKKLTIDLNANVIFHGLMPKNNVVEWLQRCDCFVLNSSYEGFPHAVLEAMQNKIAVVASAVGGTPEAVKNNETGLLFKYNNVDEIIEKITLCRNDHCQREKLIKKAFESVKKFTDIDAMICEYVNVFNNVK